MVDAGEKLYSFLIDEITAARREIEALKAKLAESRLSNSAMDWKHLPPDHAVDPLWTYSGGPFDCDPPIRGGP